MNKEEILALSRKENAGQADERETQALGLAARVGIMGGVIACVMLAFAGRVIFKNPEIGFAGWFVYFAILGSRSLVLYKHLKKRGDLVWTILGFLLAAFFAAMLLVVCL